MESRFYDLARAVLDALIAGWPTDPDEAAPLPDRQYVAFGTVAWDCEQVTVSGMRSYTMEADVALEGVVSNPVFFSRSIEVEIQIVRCIPTTPDDADFPAAVDIELSALTAMTDEQQMRDVLIAAQQDGTLAIPQGLAFGNWSAVGPQGGFGGGALRVRLAGY